MERSAARERRPSEAQPMTSTATTGTTGRSTDPKAKVNLHRGEFSNEAFIDFTKPENRKAMEDALAQVRAMFGREYPLTIGGERITTTEKIKSYNPSHPDQVIGVFQKATLEMANQAVEKAHAAFERWKRVPVEERVACLYRAADILRKRRYEAEVADGTLSGYSVEEDLIHTET